jgi:diaminobutyrate-2-oxoglutarate transaminase
VVPDIVTLSKSLSGYGLPLSVVLLRRGLDVWSPGEHTGTFRGNQLAFVTAAAALELWDRPAFQANLSASIVRLERFAAAVAPVVRLQGMVLGIDLGSPLRAESVQRRCFERGLIVELCGREDEVIKVMPPLTIDRASLERGLDLLGEALAQAAAGAGSMAATPAGVRVAGTR